LNIKVVTQDGNEIFFKCRTTTPLQRLMTAFCNRQGVAMNSVRFLFDGDRFNPLQTPMELEMEDGDVIDVMVEQQGFLPWTTPPALATTDPTAAKGEAVLQGELVAAALTSADVSAICAHATGPHPRIGRVGLVQEERLLSVRQCEDLIRVFESHEFSAGNSELALLSRANLGMAVGPAAATRLVDFGCAMFKASCGSSPHFSAFGTSNLYGAGMPEVRLALRRHEPHVSSPSSRIRFHRDSRRVVVHIPLNDDCEGGKLLLADDRRGRLECVARRVGVGVALDSAVVHGVSRVTTGVRYTLLVAVG
jgi:small ubiquitin-related modifier